MSLTLFAATWSGPKRNSPFFPSLEANNERYNRIIQEFVTQSQFIVITHSKWTMNTADRLYAITMQEPGVSTRVSVELTGANVA